MSAAQDTYASDEASLFEAIEVGDLARVKALITQNRELVDATDNHGVTVLMTAMYHGNREIVDLLRSQGARVDIFSGSALGDLAAVKALLDADHSLLDRLSPDGWTALHLAAFFCRSDVVAYLIEQGADIHARSNNSMNNTPLHAVMPGGQRALVELLLARGADVNSRQEGGWVALHEAALRGDADLVSLLLDYHADPTLKTDHGKTARAIAEEKGHTAVVELLRKYEQPS